MTMAHPSFYEMKQELTPKQTKSLIDFLDSRQTDNHFIEMVQEHQKYVSTLYRGIHYPLKQLVVGQTYRHWDTLSSWSTEFDVARDFNKFDYVPEQFVEDMAVSMGYSLDALEEYGTGWQEARNEFVPVVFVVKNQSGFPVNDFIEHDMYSKEKEYVIDNTEWVICDVAESYDVHGQRFYMVELE